MRVLMVFHSLKGGAPRCNLSLMRGLRARGHEVYAVLPTDIKDPAFEAQIAEAANGVYRMMVPWAFAHPVAPDASLAFRAARVVSIGRKRVQLAVADRKLQRLIHELGIDVVHVGSSVTQAGLRAARREGVPTAWHIHELPEQQHGLVPYPWTHQDAQYDAADAVVCVSKAVASQVGPDRPNTHVVWNGLPACHLGEGTAERLETVGNRPLRVAFAGGLSGPKGIQTVLDAFEGLPLSVQLDVYGGCPGTEGERYKSRIEESLPNVTYCGYCNDFSERLKDHDVLIVASTFEAFGRVTAEAMLRKVLVVGADSGGTPELLADGRGLLFQPGDAASLRAALGEAARLSGDPYREIVERAYDFARANLGEDAYYDGVERIYRELVPEAGA